MSQGLRISKEMLKWICCPASHQTLRIASPAEVEQLDRWRQAGQLSTVGGETISEPLAEALIRDDGQIAYAVVDGIARLIVDDGIRLPNPFDAVAGQDRAAESA